MSIWDYMKKAPKGPSPVSVALSPEGRLAVRWDDGAAHDLTAHALRAGCQCAACVDEFTRAQLLDVSKIPADIAIASVEPIGNYAVRLVFSDGHDTGLFDWRLLRRLGEPAAT